MVGVLQVRRRQAVHSRHLPHLSHLDFWFLDCLKISHLPVEIEFVNSPGRDPSFFSFKASSSFERIPFNIYFLLTLQLAVYFFQILPEAGQSLLDN